MLCCRSQFNVSVTRVVSVWLSTPEQSTELEVCCFDVCALKSHIYEVMDLLSVYFLQFTHLSRCFLPPKHLLRGSIYTWIESIERKFRRRVDAIHDE